jgi:hypothetical protein
MTTLKEALEAWITVKKYFEETNNYLYTERVDGAFKGIKAKSAPLVRRSLEIYSERTCATLRFGEDQMQCATCRMIWDTKEEKPPCPKHPVERA